MPVGRKIEVKISLRKLNVHKDCAWALRASCYWSSLAERWTSDNLRPALRPRLSDLNSIAFTSHKHALLGESIDGCGPPREVAYGTSVLAQNLILVNLSKNGEYHVRPFFSRLLVPHLQ